MYVVIGLDEPLVVGVAEVMSLGRSSAWMLWIHDNTMSCIIAESKGFLQNAFEKCTSPQQFNDGRVEEPARITNGNKNYLLSLRHQLGN